VNKIVYEKPLIISLNTLQGAHGACSQGTGASPKCDAGSMAGKSCLNGTAPGTGCFDGNGVAGLGPAGDNYYPDRRRRAPVR
jgi:hypothetical protein